MIRWLAAGFLVAAPALAQTVDQKVAVIVVGQGAVWIDTGNGDKTAKSIAVPVGGSIVVPLIFGPNTLAPVDAVVSIDSGWTATLGGGIITVKAPTGWTSGNAILRYNGAFDQTLGPQMQDQAIVYIKAP